MKRIYVLLTFTCAILAGCTSQPGRTVHTPSSDAFVLESPDGQLHADIYLDTKGTPVYTLSYGGTSVIEPSALGFELRGTVKYQGLVYKGNEILKPDELPPYLFNSDFELVGTATDSFDEVWEPVWGEEASIRNHYNELLVKLRHKGDGKLMDIRFRLFDDGLGFRYEFPSDQPLVHFVIKEELTEFNCAQDNLAWWIPGDFDTQEYEYATSKLSEIPSVFPSKTNQYNSSTTLFSKGGVQTSLQMKTPEGLYVNIHEAALVDYPCMHLLADGKSLRSFLTPDAEGWKGRLETPCVTPWRTVQVAPSATAQLASRLVLNLNEPCALDDVSWIHPVKYMGVWWEMIAGAGSWAYTDATSVKLDSFDYTAAVPNGRHSANNANVRKYIDFAAENGFDALLIEGWNIGWEEWANCNKDYVFDFLTPYPDFDIEALNEYAHSRGIKLVMHHETSSSVRNYERHMEAAYTLMNKYGYDAVKSGYVGDIQPLGEYHYSQSTVNHYLYAVTEAAKHHIMVNAHEAVRPTGLCRTWPNLIGNESARGTEYQAFGGTVPEHVTILPFTRLNGGPMDFTPGIFNFKNKAVPTTHPQTTLAKQLSLYILLYTPWQMAADMIENYAYQPALSFIESCPTSWEETRVLEARIGKYLVIARKDRESDNWFVGGATDKDSRDLSIELSFLDADARYRAVIYKDGDGADYRTNPYPMTILQQDVTQSSVLPIHLASSGGFAIRIEKTE